MKNFITLLFLVIPFNLSAQEQDTVRIGIFMLPPFMMETGPDKKAGGVAVAFWEKHIAPKMKIKVKAIGPYPVMRTQKMLESGDIDLITNMTKIPEREKSFIYPPTPLAQITSCLVVLKDSSLKKVETQTDLYGLTIGFIHGGYIPEIIKHEKIHLNLVSSTNFFQQLIDMLDAKRIDAKLHINYLSLLYDLKNLGIIDRYRIILLPSKKINAYCVFRKSERGRRLAEKFEKINAPLFKKGVYNKMAVELLNSMQ